MKYDGDSTIVCTFWGRKECLVTQDPEQNIRVNVL